MDREITGEPPAACCPQQGSWAKGNGLLTLGQTFYLECLEQEENGTRGGRWVRALENS